MSEIPDGSWLNIGSGDVVSEGWIHLDGSWRTRLSRRPWLAFMVSRLTGQDAGRWSPHVRYWDARQGLPFRTATVSVVYASHLLEHLYRDQALFLLEEARRVLKPGGICRAVVPDLASIVRWYLEHGASEAARERASSDLLMEMLGLRSRAAPSRGILGFYRRWTDFDSHKWMYDERGLLTLFREAGFESPRPRAYLDSDIPAERLTVVEKRDRIVDGAGICVESPTCS